MFSCHQWREWPNVDHKVSSLLSSQALLQANLFVGPKHSPVESRLSPSPRSSLYFLLSALCILFSKLPTKEPSKVNPTLLLLFPSSNKHLYFLSVLCLISFPNSLWLFYNYSCVFWLSLISLPKSYCRHVISTPSSPSYTPMPQYVS